MKKLTKKKSNKKKIKSFELIVRNFEALTPEGRLFFWQSLEGMASVGGESMVIQREKLQEILEEDTRQFLANRVRSSKAKVKDQHRKRIVKRKTVDNEKLASKQEKRKKKSKVYPHGMPEGTPQWGSKLRPKLLSGGGANGTGKRR